jgi:hypothetical protein
MEGVEINFLNARLGDHHKIDHQQAAKQPKSIAAHLATSHPFKLSESPIGQRSSL